jgi:putative SOS response-associated peptidase YedK
VPGADWFCFAGIWDRAHTADGDIESYALATLPPDALFEQYHDRRPLILDREDHAAWLDSPETAKALFTAPKDRDLTVERAA